MRMLWLKEDCLKAGLKVVEVPGWKTRGTPFPAMPNTVIAHHTATPANAKGDLPTKRLLVEGRSDLPGPLCQVALGRNGTVYLIASGKANHAGKGEWRGVDDSARTLGIEAEHPGTGGYPKVQRDAYVLLVATMLRSIGQDHMRACGHKEWALPRGRKTDPNFDMNAFRSAVADRMTPTKEWDEMATKDEIRQVVAEELAKAVKTLHDDHVVLLRGTPNHPYNLTSIGKKVVG